jgi:hypothetical protein
VEVSRLVAIDPGPTESAVLVYEDGRPVEWEKMPNDDALFALDEYSATAPLLAIEMIASYGMAVGAEVFDTCVWIGRFTERWGGDETRLVYRREVKLHLCGSAKAKDPNVRQALLDKFGPGKELAVGRKATPGPLYGLTGDCWSALGVAVTAAETEPVALLKGVS